MTRLSRRQVVLGVGAAGLGLLAGCGRLPWQAAQPARVIRMGLLAAPRGIFTEPFKEGLRDYGYVEGQNILIESRWEDGREDKLPEFAADLVRLPVDIIAASGSTPSLAAKSASSTIPIVMIASNDPVGVGLAVSLARPGGNVTGMSLLSKTLSAKQVDLLKEAVPTISYLAVLSNPAYPALARDVSDIMAAAAILGLRSLTIDVRGPDDFEAAFEAASREQVDAIIVPSVPLFGTHRTQIAALAAKYRLPGMNPHRDYVESGGLMAYGANSADVAHRAAAYVDKILKGANPADLPVEQPKTFDFVVNLTTAEALGITIPESIRLQVTEVIR